MKDRKRLAAAVMALVLSAGNALTYAIDARATLIDIPTYIVQINANGISDDGLSYVKLDQLLEQKNFENNDTLKKYDPASGAFVDVESIEFPEITTAVWIKSDSEYVPLSEYETDGIVDAGDRITFDLSDYKDTFDYVENGDEYVSVKGTKKLDIIVGSGDQLDPGNVRIELDISRCAENLDTYNAVVDFSELSYKDKQEVPLSDFFKYVTIVDPTTGEVKDAADFSGASSLWSVNRSIDSENNQTTADFEQYDFSDASAKLYEVLSRSFSDSVDSNIGTVVIGSGSYAYDNSVQNVFLKVSYKVPSLDDYNNFEMTKNGKKLTLTEQNSPSDDFEESDKSAGFALLFSDDSYDEDGNYILTLNREWVEKVENSGYEVEAYRTCDLEIENGKDFTDLSEIVLKDGASPITDELIGRGYSRDFRETEDGEPNENNSLVVVTTNADGKLLDIVPVTIEISAEELDDGESDGGGQEDDDDDDIDEAPSPFSIAERDKFFNVTSFATADGVISDDKVKPIVSYTDKFGNTRLLDSSYNFAFQTVVVADPDADLSNAAPVYDKGNYQSFSVYNKNKDNKGVESASDFCDFSGGKQVTYTVSAGNADEAKKKRTYKVKALQVTTGGGNLGVCGPDTVREVLFNDEFKYHDILLLNLGDADISDLKVELQNGKFVKLDDYWTLDRSGLGTEKLKPFYNNGEFSNNMARIRLLPKSETDDAGNTVTDGAVSGKLVITADGKKTEIDLTGISQTPTLPDTVGTEAVKYVPFKTVISSGMDYPWINEHYTITGQPDWLEVDEDGEIWGTPQKSGSFPLHVKVSFDSVGDLEFPDIEKDVTLNVKDNTSLNVYNEMADVEDPFLIKQSVGFVSDNEHGYTTLVALDEDTYNKKLEEEERAKTDDSLRPFEGLPEGSVGDWHFYSEADFEHFMKDNVVIGEIWLNGEKLVYDEKGDGSGDYTAVSGSTEATIYEKTLVNKVKYYDNTLAIKFEDTDENGNTVFKTTAQNVNVSFTKNITSNVVLRLVDGSGSPIAGKAVQLHSAPQSGTTNSSGYVKLSNAVTSGDHILTVDGNTYSFGIEAGTSIGFGNNVIKAIDGRNMLITARYADNTVSIVSVQEISDYDSNSSYAPDVQKPQDSTSSETEKPDNDSSSTPDNSSSTPDSSSSTPDSSSSTSDETNNSGSQVGSNGTYSAGNGTSNATSPTAGTSATANADGSDSSSSSTESQTSAANGGTDTSGSASGSVSSTSSAAADNTPSPATGAARTTLTTLSLICAAAALFMKKEDE